MYILPRRQKCARVYYLFSLHTHKYTHTDRHIHTHRRARASNSLFVYVCVCVDRNDSNISNNKNYVITTMIRYSIMILTIIMMTVT